MKEKMIQAQAMAACIACARMTGYMREVMLAIGRAADGMIVSSRRRLLAHLRALGGEAAALEMNGSSWSCSICGAWRCPAARRLRARR